MKKVGLIISSIYDIEPIVLRDNQVAVYVMMTDEQIERNIWALNESKAGRKTPKLRMVKNG